METACRYFIGLQNNEEELKISKNKRNNLY